MALSAKLLRAQLNLLKPFISGQSLEFTRRGQDQLGALMEFTRRKDILLEDCALEGFECAWVTPRQCGGDTVILYLHGGGYTCGDLDYAKGFASILAAECSIKVFCAAYRLAPETPFPGALDDALSAYTYLLRSGFGPQQIMLCGESAGGGLIYALCLKLKELSMPQPAGVIAISPWTDLTMSGASMSANLEVDPSLAPERLAYYAACYAAGTTPVTDPLVSPLWGELKGLAPSLIFVGGDEILLDDSRRMHEKLLAAGCQSKLIVAPELWHGYVLFCLKERQCDFDEINAFLKKNLRPSPHQLQWMKLDNAAKIYPASLNKNWSNVYRISATLTEPVDKAVLRSALEVTLRRFPSVAVRIRRGIFWYYFEQIPAPPELYEERSYPLTRMTLSQIRRCAFRVIAYERRIAVEMFHAVTDGNGALVFLKTLLAEYLTQKYGALIPTGQGVLDRAEEPRGAELEDSFLQNDGEVSMSRRESAAYRLTGTPVHDARLRVTTLIYDTETIRAQAKKNGVSVTGFLCAALMRALLELQRDTAHGKNRKRPVKVLIPVNLRPLFGSSTMRNFVLYVTPAVDPRMGDYSMAELCAIVHHSMGIGITPKNMSARITANVRSEQSALLKIMPLFIKDLALKTVFRMVGERTSCLSLSNLGAVHMPEEMAAYVERMDLVLGVQQRAPYNCGVLSFKDKLYINFIRNITEPKLEYAFYRALRELGIRGTVESNQL